MADELQLILRATWKSKAVKQWQSILRFYTRNGTKLHFFALKGLRIIAQGKAYSPPPWVMPPQQFSAALKGQGKHPHPLPFQGG